MERLYNKEVFFDFNEFDNYYSKIEKDYNNFINDLIGKMVELELATNDLDVEEISFNDCQNIMFRKSKNLVLSDPISGELCKSGEELILNHSSLDDIWPSFKNTKGILKTEDYQEELFPS